MVKKEKTASANRKIRILEAAFSDIDEITDFIAFINQQPLNAIKVADALFEAIDRIGRTPFAFKECPYIQTKTKLYRQAVCLSWLIIYKVTATE
jgi:plasmid stabilization system protein ParE